MFSESFEKTMQLKKNILGTNLALNGVIVLSNTGHLVTLLWSYELT